MSNYRGITYPKIFQFNWVQSLWKRFMCPRDCHLWDEVIGSGGHYLVCDPCQLMVMIESIDDQYTNSNEASDGTDLVT